MPDTDTTTRSLLDAVAPDSWMRPAEPPTAGAPEPLLALRASLKLTLRRDLAHPRLGLDTETTDTVISAVLAALAKALSPDVSLADATAACLIAERVTLAVALALEPPVDEWFPQPMGSD